MSTYEEFEAQKPELARELVNAAGGDVALARSLYRQAQAEGRADAVRRERPRALALGKLAAAAGDEAAVDRAIRHVEQGTSVEDAFVEHLLENGANKGAVTLAMQSMSVTAGASA